MKRLQNVKRHHVISATALVGVALFALNFNGTSQQSSGFEDFVLFAEKEVMLENEVQVSSGNLGSNNIVDIQKDNIISGDLFADKITLDKNAVINGNVSFNTLQIKKETEILGLTTTPISLPIVELPDAPDFQTGNQDFTFQGENNTLPSGNYRNITLEKDSKLILTGGIYNIARLFIKENSTLVFETQTILNIERELKSQQKISILAGPNAQFNALQINYIDKKPVQFGKNSFLNFKLLAPEADVRIGEQSTFKGQIFANKITVGKSSLLSIADVFVKISDLRNIITDEEDGSRFAVNEIVVNFKDDATREDADAIARIVNGTITGFVPSANMYQIEVATSDIAGLEQLINEIEMLNNPKIEGFIKNYLLNAL
ncbi:MAG: hypothetical protein COW88_02125 [Candidatus Lloydbacteria bacterium CG22_combo_CG10-13_8_21_14_all_47_15]|uniref:Fervidolysin-like N-terminal prodomain domain-containing protein n=1 Tax=Candidatus Lloydbacteria bacterium CG22_combo_CG10-13_8_21_14_all_47_15 TaxID=1974635 RepID=A0A2H0CTZ6_9BACT|nr:MAG: hypothetical protein COW88_02125 [Candidatus Lloydbacteria bacterium CG22_combo_CG10-13_8_21_14_all_47_15]